MTDRILKPIAIIHTDFKEKFGIPRQSGRVKSAVGTIEFLPPYNDKSAIKGITEFSHLWLIFGFSKVDRHQFSPTVRPPRLGGNTRIGVFSTRSPFRPNGLGISAVKLEGVSEKGELIVSGIDLLDKTPIYDVKPYLPYADIIETATGGFAEKSKCHRLEITDGEMLLNIIPESKRQTVIDCLCDDPRPSYQEDKDRVYSMRFAEFDIHFTVEKTFITIIGIDKL